MSRFFFFVQVSFFFLQLCEQIMGLATLYTKEKTPKRLSKKKNLTVNGIYI